MDKLLYERNVMYPTIKKALDIVKKYIEKRKLLLVGGQAIDYVLRQHGGKLYDDDVIPDYDFLATDYLRDAIILANELIDAKIEHVSVIRAKHTTTLRVRIANITVADITYAPKEIIDQIPFIIYENIRIMTVPALYWFMHLSLIYPFEGAPMTAIAHRWWKDMERYETLFSATEFPTEITRMLRYADTPHELRVLPKYATLGVLTGYAGLTMEDKSGKTCARYGILEMYSDNPTKVIECAKRELGISGKIVIYNSLLDILPECYVLCDGDKQILRVYNNFNSMISTGVEIGKYTAVNAQGILLYLLLAGDVDNYLYLKSMVESANTKCKYQGKYKYISRDEYYRREYYNSRSRRRKEIKNISNPEQLLPGVKCYGATNIPLSSQFMMECEREPAAKLQLPSNIYFKNGLEEPRSHDMSKFHQIDGNLRFGEK